MIILIAHFCPRAKTIFFFQIVGEPINQLAADMAESEKQRVTKQQQMLGEAGLSEKASILEKANDENEVSHRCSKQWNTRIVTFSIA